jgi:hypothetical protein
MEREARGMGLMTGDEDDGGALNSELGSLATRSKSKSKSD